MFTKFSSKEKAIESKEILAKLFQENENIEINKSIVDKFCYIMDKSSTKDIQKYSILINQLQNIENEDKFKASEEDALVNYRMGLFDIFELGQIFYKEIPDNFNVKYGSNNYWSEMLKTEIYNAFAKTYIQIAQTVNPNYAKDILNFVLADNLDCGETIKLKMKLVGFDNKNCEELKDKLNKIPKLEDNDKNELLSQLDNIINKGQVSQDALYTFNCAKRNARDYNLLNALNNAMKIILQLNGYDLNKLKENNNK